MSKWRVCSQDHPPRRLVWLAPAAGDFKSRQSAVVSCRGMARRSQLGTVLTSTH